MSKPKIVTCWNVYGNSDTTEGRGPLVRVGRFSSKEAAADLFNTEWYRRKYCVMGFRSSHDAYVKVDSIGVYDSVEDFGIVG